MQHEGRVVVVVGQWKRGMMKPFQGRGSETGIAKLKGAENDGEMPRSPWSRACLCLCFVEGAAAIKYLQRL